MKNILIMGGGVNQIPLLITAKNSGYHIVLCDENEKVIGKGIADDFIRIDISKSDILMGVCKDKNIDGIVCNTESLMSVLAKVQSEMGYIGNTMEAVLKINDKYLFRQIQAIAGTFTPVVKCFNNYRDAINYAERTRSKLILKPEMCSGSRGIFIVEDHNDLTEEKFNICALYSRNHCVLLEQYVDFSDKLALEAEVFLFNGEIVFMGLFRTVRDRKYNIIPQIYYSDNELDGNLENIVRCKLQKIFSTAGICWGEYNVELSFTKDNEVFVIEINARQGGMMLPDFVHIYSGVDLNKLLISTSVNDVDYMMTIAKKDDNWNKNCVHFRVITDKSGIYNGYNAPEKLLKYLVKRYSYVKVGDTVTVNEHDYITVEVLDFNFRNKKTKKEFENKLCDLISVDVR